MERKGRFSGGTVLSRRGFLLGTTGLALAAAGCGGGGDSPGGRYNGTYRDINGDIAASVTVDEDGRVTFWSLLADEEEPFADFGQLVLRDDDFSQTIDDVTTFAEIRNERVLGRTQDALNSSLGFDWDAFKAPSPNGARPPRSFIGTFEGQGLVNGVEMTALLGVSPDGNATLFAYFELAGDPSRNLYSFESLSIDDRGDGYDYYLDLEGDRIFLDETAGNSIRLGYTFGSNAGVIDVIQGETLVLTLDPTRAQRGVGARRAARGASGLQRAVKAVRTKAVRKR